MGEESQVKVNLRASVPETAPQAEAGASQVSSASLACSLLRSLLPLFLFSVPVTTLSIGLCWVVHMQPRGGEQRKRGNGARDRALVTQTPGEDEESSHGETHRWSCM